MRTLSLLIVAWMLMVTNTAAGQTLDLAPAFQTGMVFQRNTLVSPVWGRAAPNSAVTVQPSWTKRAYEVVADARGDWRTNITVGNPGGPHTMTVESGDEQITLEDVLIGEVWICSGQSNMEWPLHLVDGGTDAIASADHPTIRLMTVERAVGAAPAWDCAGTWERCSPETVRDFSAVAYFFGRQLQAALDVPIGLISTNWGGTPAEAWTSREGLAPFEAFEVQLRDLALIGLDPSAAEFRHKQAWANWAEPINRADTGMVEGWHAPEYDDDAWKTLEVPGGWNRSPDLQAFDGVVWYRRTFEVPESWGGRALELSLGPIDDMDRVFVNGRKVAVTETDGQWATPRNYVVRAKLTRPGLNTITIRIIDTMGGGGLYGDASQIYVRPNKSDLEPLSLAGQWRYRKSVGADRFGPRPEPAVSPNKPSTLFNGMIAPLAPLTVRGAIWYQGESNVGRAAQYEALFPAMIDDWRRAFQSPELPFYFVQIAPFAYGNAPGDGRPALLREAQRQTMSHPYTGMAVTMDIGDPADIHPGNKHDVGDRLARWALAKTYGRDDIVPSGPTFRWAIFDDGAARLSFDFAEPSLRTRDGEPVRDLWIAGADRVFRPATVRIDGDVLIATHPEVPDPVAVRYGWPAASTPNLCNGVGLPASSFRSDDWDDPYTFED